MAGVPDAGIWEYRTEWEPQTFSSLMCWAAADRMALIDGPACTVPRRRISPGRGPHPVADYRARMECKDGEFRRPLRRLGSGRRPCFRWRVCDSFRYDDPRLTGTIDAIAKDLAHGGWLLRYSLNDGFGKPSVAFVICTFWLIEALARAGRRVEAAHVVRSYLTRRCRRWVCFPRTTTRRPPDVG